MPDQSRRRSRPNRRNRRRVPLTRRYVSTQGDGPSYQGQQLAILDIPGDVFLVATNGGGTLATSIPINPASLCANFHGNLNNTFQEYRIRRVVFAITAVTDAIGATLFRWEEKNAAIPTLADMENSTSLMVVNSNHNPRSNFTMTFTPRDIIDLPFNQINTDPSIAYLKVYSDTLHMISPISTDLFIVRPVMRVEFRGFGFN